MGIQVLVNFLLASESGLESTTDKWWWQRDVGTSIEESHGRSASCVTARAAVQEEEFVLGTHLSVDCERNRRFLGLPRAFGYLLLAQLRLTTFGTIWSAGCLDFMI